MQVNLNLQSNTNRYMNTQSIQKTSNVISAPNNFVPQLLTFGGTKKNQIAIITSECGDLLSTGGVGTVAQDLAQGKLFNESTSVQVGNTLVQGDKPILIMPYYNGQCIYEKDPDGPFLPDKRDAAKYKKVETLKKGGKPIFTKEILQPKGMTPDALSADKYKGLELVTTKKMDFAGKTQEIALYRVKGAKKMQAYMIATEATMRMRKPYEGAGGYSSKLRPLGEPDAYAEFCKAVVELTPELEQEGVNPRHWLLNDAQCAYIPEYINQKNLAGSAYYNDVKLSYIMHNAGLGYQQRQNAQTMALNFISNQDIEALNGNAVWNSLTDAEKERVYREAVKPFLTSDYQASPVMVALRHCDNGSLVTHCSTVAPSYAKSIAKGNGFADGIKDILLQRMYEHGNFTGITNGLDTENFGPQFLYSANPKEIDFYDAKLAMQKVETTDKAAMQKLSEAGLISTADKNAIQTEMNEVSALQKLRKDYSSASSAQKKLQDLVDKNAPQDELKKAQLTPSQRKALADFKALRSEIEADVAEEIKKAGGTKSAKLNLSENEIISRKLAKINSPTGMTSSNSIIQQVVEDGNKVSYYVQPFEKYSKDTPVDEVIKIKQRNLQNFLTRIYLHNNAGLPVDYVAMRDKNAAKISGDISLDLLQRMKKGEKITSFVAWGRADDQKAVDVTIDSFIKFVTTKPEEAKNAVLVMGGPIEGSHLEKEIRAKIELAKRSCKGNFVFMEWFAPNKVLSTAGLAPIIPSRWAPCELTDLEPMRYGGTPIVTGLEGLYDKNFDLIKDPNRATGFTTNHHMNTPLADIDVSKLTPDGKKAVLEYRKKYASIIEKQRNELKSILFEGDVRYTAPEIDYRLRLFIDNSESCGELKALRQKTTDALVIDDLVEAMSKRVSISADDERKIVKNALNMKTKWSDNGLLQSLPNADSVKTSARQLYYERHFNPSRQVSGSSTKVRYRSVMQVFQEIFRDKIEKAKRDAEMKKKQAATLIHDTEDFFERATTVITNKKTFAEKYLNKQTAFAFLGIAALGALGCYLLKSDDDVRTPYRRKAGMHKRR